LSGGNNVCNRIPISETAGVTAEQRQTTEPSLLTSTVSGVGGPYGGCATEADASGR
jgi:hypothetical protein